MHTISNPDYDLLISQIGQVYTAAQNAAKHAIVTEQLKANWYIGCYIVEYEQKGNKSYACERMNINSARNSASLGK